METINWEQFGLVELRVGTIIEVADFHLVVTAQSDS